MISSSLVLAIDTCSACPGAALADASGILATSHLGRDSGRAESVGPLVASLLAEIGAEGRDISGFGVVNGPGSYTGSRVGLALLRGLALLDALKVAALTSLELSALSATDAEGDLCVLLDAGRGKFYAAGYHKGAGGVLVDAVPIHVASSEQLGSRFGGEPGRWIVCHEAGSAVGLDWAAGYREFPSERAGPLARWAVERLACGQGRPCESVFPVYAGSVSFRRNLSKVLLGPDAPG